MYTWMPEEDASYNYGYKPIYGCQELNSGPLEEQPVLLTSEPSIHPTMHILNVSFKMIYLFLFYVHGYFAWMYVCARMLKL